MGDKRDGKEKGYVDEKVKRQMDGEVFGTLTHRSQVFVDQS